MKGLVYDFWYRIANRPSGHNLDPRFPVQLQKWWIFHWHENDEAASQGRTISEPLLAFKFRHLLAEPFPRVCDLLIQQRELRPPPQCVARPAGVTDQDGRITR